MRQDYRYHAVNEDTVVSARSIKKSTGSYYTPEYLANLISRDAIFAWLSNHTSKQIQTLQDITELSSAMKAHLLQKTRKIRILDPSVGEGVFLLAAGNLVVDILTALGDKTNEEKRKFTIAKDSLFGVDLAAHAIETSIKRISSWAENTSFTNIKQGNSLVGFIDASEETKDLNAALIENTIPFLWGQEFPDIFTGSKKGFDIIVGNPPYGNILGQIERDHISKFYSFNVGGNRTGTWNSAAHFIVRAISLLNDVGQLGFLVPNSILRVKQFTKTREFLLNRTKLWKIIDEGSPFDGVTLEMVSVYCMKTKESGDNLIVESRRNGLERSNIVDISVLKNSKLLSIYHDHIFSTILSKGEKYRLIANRGRDIPKEHTRKKTQHEFRTPYITSGRSVRRYHFNENHIFYTDDWFLQDSALRDSFENELLVATKNYRYPRCVLKPKGVIHGGGIVKISPQYANANLRVLGLILNSRLVRHVCIRYLTNYSQLTCCLNTGIMEELPIILPKRPLPYSALFDSLTTIYSNVNNLKYETKLKLERLADALVYALYLCNDDSLERLVDEVISESKRTHDSLCKAVDVLKIQKTVDDILDNDIVRELEQLGNFPKAKKSLRY
ncbi:MAG: Eco57I restriction-modification methylase domain-containing protein [Candidatus Thorarchaeota archaeon]